MSGYAGNGRDPSVTRREDAVRDGTDHRLLTYRTPGGDLMCLAQAGALSSEARVTASFCGTDAGCRGMWRCLQSPDFPLLSRS